VKHNDDVAEGIDRHQAIFLVGREPDRYTIMSGNPLHKGKTGALKATLDRVNTLDKEGLKDLYRDIIQDTTISEKGGAGLGFVDMARKSGEKLDYGFADMSKDFSFFWLKVNVSRDQTS
jgi:hypothetical protein